MAYEKPLPKYGEEQLIKILLDPNLDRQHVCTTWPITFNSSSTFVIDISKLKHPDDVKKDNFGKWKHSGSHRTPYRVHFGETGDIKLQK